MNGADLANAVNGAAAAAAAAASLSARRASQKPNGVDDNSPISRTGTPNLYASHLPHIYQNVDDQFQAQQLSGFVGPDGRAPSPLNGEQMPQTTEQLLATNASLKTRVSELEVIQELYRGRIQQLEQEEANRQVAEKNKNEAEQQLRAQLESVTKELEESHRRENMLKRRLDELEVELKEAKEAAKAAQEELRKVKEELEAKESERPAKKQRVEEPQVKSEEQVAASTS